MANQLQRLDHDYRPNASYFFDQRTLTHYVHVMTAISPLEEISIAYINSQLPRQERRRQLSTSWGFDCSCSLCDMHPALIRASDARLVQIDVLSRRFTDFQKPTSQMAQALVSLCKQERLYGWLSFAYQRAALASCRAGDRWRAVEYASLAVEFLLLKTTGSRTAESRR